MSFALELAAAACLVIGGVFALVGSYGLLKLDDPMKRLHAPTKASTLGVGGILAGSIFAAAAREDGTLHEILILAFLFVTAPVTAHFLAKANIRRKVPHADLPDPPRDETWAVLRPAAPDRSERPD